MDEKPNQGRPGQKIEIVYRPRTSLNLNPKNPRQHSATQLKKLARSIKAFGFNTAILVDKDLNVIAGHARAQAAERLGIDQVPTICLEHLTERQAQAYIIADNKLAELAEWDESLLTVHLRELASVELDFDLDATGFELAEIDLRLSAVDAPVDATVEPEPSVPAPPTEPISRVGDIWQLGPHLLLCSDALDAASYDRLLQGDRADVVFTDPPYNVPIAGHASGLGRTKHSDFVMASGEMTPEGFTEFLVSACRNMARHSRDGALNYICMDWRHVRELMEAGSTVYSELKNLCVWVKSNAGMGSLYRSQHELVFVYKNGRAPHLNNVQLGRHGRNRSNVWNYPGVATPAGGDEERGLLGLHPTVKPVTLVADVLMDSSPRNGLVLDPFAGSGSTIIAAERTGRRARAVEMDPRYVDVAIRRWQRFTRQTAIHLETGKPFEEDRSRD